jgi:hypothetical protein
MIFEMLFDWMDSFVNPVPTPALPADTPKILFRSFFGGFETLLKPLDNPGFRLSVPKAEGATPFIKGACSVVL